MKLTRREALARGGGLLAALGLGKLLPTQAKSAPPQAPDILPPMSDVGLEPDTFQGLTRRMTATEVLERRHVVKSYNVGHVTYTLQQSHNNADWHDAAYYLCGPGVQPHVDRDHIDPHNGRYVRVVVKS